MSYPEEPIYSEIAREVERAQAKFAPMNSAHEAAAVIREEFEEFWDEVKRKERTMPAMREELIQLAAMAVRAILDLRLDDPRLRPITADDFTRAERVAEAGEQ